MKLAAPLLMGSLMFGALALPAAAQPVRLELRIVPQDGTLPAPITDRPDTQHIDLTVVGQVRRFEVQYRIIDLLPNDLIVPAGLSAGEFSVCATGDVGASSLQRAPISRFEAQQAGAVPPAAVDASGNPTAPLAGATGMHRPFRSGTCSPPPCSPQYGTLAGACITGIIPLSFGQSDQNAANGWYGLYSFELHVGAGACGRIDLTVAALADPGTGNTFGYFSDGQPVPITGSTYLAGTAFVNVLPPFPGCTLPVCPAEGVPPLSPLISSFPINGVITNTGWYWRIESDPAGTPFQSMTSNVYVPGDLSNTTTTDVANDFAASINNYFHSAPRSCTATQVTAIPGTVSGDGFLSISTAGGSRARLYVGTVLSGGAGCLVAPAPATPCEFQPSIRRLALPGTDRNGNGVDDLIDIDAGASADANFNGVPDESEGPCQLRLTGLPTSRIVSPGGNASFTTGGAGNAPITFRWRRNGVNIANGPTGNGGAFAGVTTPTLTITNARLGDGARYDCVVQNPCAALVAGGATLTIDCPADFNGSGGISVQDMFDFLRDYFSGVPSADFNRGGGITVQDIFDYLGAYFTGCP